MTPIFILAKDHLRRIWKLTAIWSLLFGFTLFNDAYYADSSMHGSGRFFSSIYAFYIIVALSVQPPCDPNVLRTWRTLPFRESTLAKLVWSMTALTAPALSFLIVLLVELLLLCYGKTYSQPIAWPFFFLLLVTLGSGPLTFLRTSTPLGYASATAARNAQPRGLFSTSYAVKVLFAVVWAGATIYMILYPPPYRWSDLGSRQFAGMCLAAYLICKSYQMRFWLLQPISPHNAVTHQSLIQESAPIHYGSPLAALAQEWKTTVRGTLRVVLGCIGLGYLVLFLMTWSGMAPRDGDLYEISAQMVTLIVVLTAAIVIFTQLVRVYELKAVRSLPLTGKQCVMLFLSRSYAVSLAVVPCITAYLWLAGYGPLSTLLIAGILFSAGLCPFAMFMLARFGGGFVFMFFINVIVFAALGLLVVIPILGVHLTLMSTPVLSACALLLAVLGGIGYYGMHHLIENSSDAYKRKMLPQYFGQGVGR